MSLIIVLHLSFPFFSRFSTTRNTYKNHIYPFLGYFWEKYEKCTRSRSVGRAHARTDRSARVFFFLQNHAPYFATRQIDRKSWLASRHKTGKRGQNERRTKEMKWREKEGRKRRNMYARVLFFFSFFFRPLIRNSTTDFRWKVNEKTGQEASSGII